MDLGTLARTAEKIVTPGRGILAADESSGTIKKRFTAIGVESTEETRRAYRDLLLSTKGAAEYVSGVILYDETIRQKSADGTPFPKLLANQGLVPGIKVDAGTKALPGHADEKITEGLDGLGERLAGYHQLGARFAKWRAVLTIGKDIPSRACLHANAHSLARYAALCQEAGLVPIVEPEVLMDGDHTLERCEEVTTATLREVFAELALQDVALEGMLLKPNMVISGLACATQAAPEQVAAATVRCFRRVVPAAVPGIVFLSGGQSSRLATENLQAINALGPHPWKTSFSYGRALQHEALEAWRGKTSNVPAAQKAYLHRAKCNGAAARGAYRASLEKELAAV